MTDNPPPLTDTSTEETTQFSPHFDQNGLVCAVVQERHTREILMVAWMNKDSLDKTLETGQAHFWSRSRQKLWLKGETSGNILVVHEILADCDQDALILLVDAPPHGTCHTGRKSCFYRQLKAGNLSFLS